MGSLDQRAAKIIKKIKYVNIASITPTGLPWNSPVYSAFDNNLNIYWISWKENQHSVNVRNNPNVFITVYDSTVPEGTGVGVYFKGQAKELSNPTEIITGLTVCYKRVDKKIAAIGNFLKNFPRRVYKFTPEKIWINGEGDINGNFIDIRTELDLNSVKKLIK